jgi:hypothetical protein
VRWKMITSRLPFAASGELGSARGSATGIRPGPISRVGEHRPCRYALLRQAFRTFSWALALPCTL